MSTEFSRLKRWLNNINNLLPFSCITRNGTPIESSNSSIILLKENSEEKLSDILETLKREVKETFHYIPINRFKREFNENLKQTKPITLSDKIALNLITLEVKLNDIFSLKQYKIEGNEINSTEILIKFKTLLLLIDCLRDEIFKSYLALTISEKLALQEKNKQMSCIFALLGILETEVRNYIKPLIEINQFSLIKPLLKLSESTLKYKRTIRTKSKHRLLTGKSNTKSIAYPLLLNDYRLSNNSWKSEKSLSNNYNIRKLSKSSEYFEKKSTCNRLLLVNTKSNYTNNTNTEKFYDNFLENVVEKNNLPSIESILTEEVNESRSSSLIEFNLNRKDKITTVSPSLLDFQLSIIKRQICEKGVQTYVSLVKSTSFTTSKTDTDETTVYDTPRIIVNSKSNITINNNDSLWKESVKLLLKQYNQQL